MWIGLLVEQKLCLLTYNKYWNKLHLELMLSGRGLHRVFIIPCLY